MPARIYIYIERERERERIRKVQACLGYKTFIANVRPSEGFITVCPVGSIPTTRNLIINYVIFIMPHA